MACNTTHRLPISERHEWIDRAGRANREISGGRNGGTSDTAWLSGLVMAITVPVSGQRVPPPESEDIRGINEARGLPSRAVLRGPTLALAKTRGHCLPLVEDQLRLDLLEHLIRLLAAAVRSDPSLVAFNGSPEIFSRTRSGRVLEYRRGDRAGLVGTGRIQWLAGEQERREFGFHVRLDDMEPQFVHINDGPGLRVPDAADYLIHDLFLQDKRRPGPGEGG